MSLVPMHVGYPEHPYLASQDNFPRDVHISHFDGSAGNISSRNWDSWRLVIAAVFSVVYIYL